MLKQQSILSLAALGLLFLCIFTENSNAQSFTLTNELNIPRENEIIALPVENIPGLTSRDKIDRVSIRQEGREGYLLTQEVDTDLDGDVDEILFCASIGPSETKTFIIETDNNSPAEKQRTDITTYSRFVPERMNDYAWENDRVAFRIYGAQNPDNNSRRPPGGGIDVFLKRVSYPVINKWYRNNAEQEGAYHIDTGEGYDPYQVGASRGLGGIGILIDDSLYVSSSFIRSRTITVGPLRTIFELSYAPWDADGQTITETKRISLDLGSHLSRIEEILVSDKPLPAITAGITLHDKKGEVKMNGRQGWFRYWEPMDDSWLGTALIADPAWISGFEDHRTEARDQSHLYITIRPAEQKAVFYAGYVWQKSGHFKSAAEWDEYLSLFSAKLASPLLVRFNK